MPSFTSDLVTSRIKKQTSGVLSSRARRILRKERADSIRSIRKANVVRPRMKLEIWKTVALQRWRDSKKIRQIFPKKSVPLRISNHPNQHHETCLANSEKTEKTAEFTSQLRISHEERVLGKPRSSWNSLLRHHLL